MNFLKNPKNKNGMIFVEKNQDLNQFLYLS